MQTTIKKTLDDYMNDPDIIDDPMPIREIQAIRLMINDETKNMTLEEQNTYHNKAFGRIMKKYSLTPITDEELNARLQRHKTAALTAAD